MNDYYEWLGVILLVWLTAYNVRLRSKIKRYEDLSYQFWKIASRDGKNTSWEHVKKLILEV